MVSHQKLAFTSIEPSFPQFSASFIGLVSYTANQFLLLPRGLPASGPRRNISTQQVGFRDWSVQRTGTYEYLLHVNKPLFPAKASCRPSSRSFRPPITSRVLPPSLSSHGVSPRLFRNAPQKRRFSRILGLHIKPCIHPVSAGLGVDLGRWVVTNEPCENISGPQYWTSPRRLGCGSGGAFHVPRRMYRELSMR